MTQSNFKAYLYLDFDFSLLENPVTSKVDKEGTFWPLQIEAKSFLWVLGDLCLFRLDIVAHLSLPPDK